MSPGALALWCVHTTLVPSTSSRNSLSLGVLVRLRAGFGDERSKNQMSKSAGAVVELVHTTLEPEIAGAVCVAEALPVESCVLVPVTLASARATMPAVKSSARVEVMPLERITHSYGRMRRFNHATFGSAIV